MKIIARTGDEHHAVVYIMEDHNGRKLECVESVQPPLSRDEKWVILVSTLFGCPIGCPMCDAGGKYDGAPDAAQIFEQTDTIVQRRYPDRRIPSSQFKIQFARMGEPCLNPAVLDVLRELPDRYHAPGLMPSVSTIAPSGCESFLESLRRIKNTRYGAGRFQLQFSIHTTDMALRRAVVPVKTLSFREIAAFGDHFYCSGDRKITLNFALANQHPVDAAVLKRWFSPERFLIKLTPLNPTYRALNNRMYSRIDPLDPDTHTQLIQHLRNTGFEVILSIGNTEENRIGSNCGQFLQSHIRSNKHLRDGYVYPIVPESCSLEPDTA